MKNKHTSGDNKKEADAAISKKQHEDIERMRQGEQVAGPKQASAETVNVEAIDLRRADCCQHCKFFDVLVEAENGINHHLVCTINGMNVTLDTICNRFEGKI